MFRPLAWLWSLAGGWLGRLAVAGLLLLACGFFLLTGLMAVYGIPWACIVYAEAPYQNFFIGLGLLFLAWVVGRGWRRPARAWRSVLGKGAMLVLSLVLSFAAGELALRAFLIRQQEENSLDRLKKLRAMGKKLPVRSTHPLSKIIEPSDQSRLVYELQPRLERLFGHRLVRTNGDGMRDDRDYALEKPEGVVRIVGIGDSGMFGWGVEQNEEYLAVLRQRLASRGDGRAYEVMNLAVPGYNTQLEVEALRFKGLKYAPDIVVVGWCDNDFSLPLFMLEAENYRRRDASFLHELIFERERFLSLIAGARFTDMRDVNREQVAEELLAGTAVDGVRHAFRELRALAEQHGFRVLVFGSMRREAREIFESLGLAYYDLKSQIPRDRYPKEWAVHYMHPRAEGHATLAGYLEAELARLGWLPSAGH